jgi:hypothetical protein
VLSLIHTHHNSLQHTAWLLSLLYFLRLSPGNAPKAVDPSGSVFHGCGPRRLGSVSQLDVATQRFTTLGAPFASNASTRSDCLLRPPTGLSTKCWLQTHYSRLTALLSLSHVATDGHSVSVSLCWGSSGSQDQMFVTVWQLLFCPRGSPSLTRKQVSNLTVTVWYSCQYIHNKVLTFYMLLHNTSHVYTVYTKPLSVQARYSR